MRFIVHFCLFFLHLGSVAFASESDDAESDDGTLSGDAIELAVCMGFGDCTPTDDSDCAGVCAVGSITLACETGDTCTAENLDLQCSVGFDFSEVVEGLEMSADSEDGLLRYTIAVEAGGSDEDIELAVLFPGTDAAVSVDDGCFPLKEVGVLGGLYICLVFNADLKESTSVAYLADVKVVQQVKLRLETPLFTQDLQVGDDGLTTEGDVCLDVGKAFQSPIVLGITAGVCLFCCLFSYCRAKSRSDSGSTTQSSV